MCFQSQLAQMRDMGITDEATARQALQATGGDLQAALELLFGDANLSWGLTIRDNTCDNLMLAKNGKNDDL